MWPRCERHLGRDQQEAQDVNAVHVTAIAGRLQETRSIRPLDFETDGVSERGIAEGQG